MKITFRTRKLEREYRKSAMATKAYGVQVAQKYIQRINIMKHVRNIDELAGLPGLRCHPLKGDRQSQFAVNLTGYYRLIFTLHGEALEIVNIEEVSKHYGD
ncbi:MAG: type II toxin-antitoxin system RelE/ParE family toxin [Deltaproteobacteria bacterium]|nr:type II toxin-antitoxin system RelE/ParE family toxin [Deltaproteobacteria bacterium]